MRKPFGICPRHLTSGKVWQEKYRLLTKQEMAEGEGFEPPEPFPVQRFSRPPHSTTLPSFQSNIGVYYRYVICVTIEKIPLTAKRFKAKLQ